MCVCVVVCVSLHAGFAVSYLRRGHVEMYAELSHARVLCEHVLGAACKTLLINP